MNFGYGYQERESLQLEEGIYTAKIRSVEFRNSKGFNIMDVFINVKGKPGYKPDHISYFDRPQDPSLQDGWDARMTRFFDAFNIPRGNWEFRSWTECIGEIEVCRNKKNPQFMDVFPYVRHEQQNQTRQPQQQRSQTRQPQPQQNNFPQQPNQKIYEGNLSRPQYVQKNTQQNGQNNQTEPLPFLDDIPF